jgi:hypothetical protein
MTGRIADRKPASKGQKSAEKRRLDDALEEGLEETFPGSDPVNASSRRLEGRAAHQARRPRRQGEAGRVVDILHNNALGVHHGCGRVTIHHIF